MQPLQLCLDTAVEDGVADTGDDAALQGEVNLELDPHSASGVRRQALLQTLDLLVRKLCRTANFGGDNTGALGDHLQRGVDDDCEQIGSTTLRHHQ